MKLPAREMDWRTDSPSLINIALKAVTSRKEKKRGRKRETKERKRPETGTRGGEVPGE